MTSLLAYLISIRIQYSAIVSPRLIQKWNNLLYISEYEIRRWVKDDSHRTHTTNAVDERLTHFHLWPNCVNVNNNINVWQVLLSKIGWSLHSHPHGIHAENVFEDCDNSGQWWRYSRVKRLVRVGAWRTAIRPSSRRRTSRHAWPGTRARMLLVTIHARWARLWPEDSHYRTQFRCCCCDALCWTVASRRSRFGRCVCFRSRWWKRAVQRLLLAAVGMGSYTPKLAVHHSVRLYRWPIPAMARAESSGWCTRSGSTTVLQPWSLHWWWIPWNRCGHKGKTGALQASVNSTFAL